MVRTAPKRIHVPEPRPASGGQQQVIPFKAWAVVHEHIRLENVRPTRIAASEHMRYLDRTYPHGGDRRVVRIEIREIGEDDNGPG